MSTTYNADDRWQEIKDTPVNQFAACGFLEVIRKSGSWDLPKQYSCIVRMYDADTGKVSEKAFKTPGRATRFLERNDANGVEMVVYDADRIYATHGFGEDDDESEGSD